MAKICTLFIIFLTINGFGQLLDTNRYLSSIFQTSSTADVQYGTAPQWVWPYWNVDLNLDVFEPIGDLNVNRPLIIFAHAGGFINGSKDVDNMQAICDSFARKGFVTATIDYRKGFDPLDDESAERAVYRAVQDGKAAVRFFKENYLTYKIDTNNVFFGGMSAGGFVAYHVAYLDQESERPASTYGGGTVNDLGCTDCAGNNFTSSSKVKAVLDFWGATIDTTFMQTGDVPIMMMHGTQDPTVPYNVGYPFGLSTLPTTYGSLPIKNQCDAVGVDYEIYVNDMSIHMMDGSNNGTWNPAPNAFWGDTLLPFTTNFIYDLLKPNTVKITNDTVYLGLNEIYTFEVSSTQGSQYIWDFNGLFIDELTNNNEETIELQFVTPGTYEIKTREFNHLLAAGEVQNFVAVVQDDVNFNELAVINVNLFPNPASNHINVESSEWINDIQLIDLSGKILKSEQVQANHFQVDLSNLHTGFYFLSVNTDLGAKILKFSKF
jgi:acetyl esterase/lipase